MTDKQKRKYIEFLTLKDDLGKIETDGTRLVFGGRESGSDDIAWACVFNEASGYMEGSAPINYIHEKRQADFGFRKDRSDK